MSTDFRVDGNPVQLINADNAMAAGGVPIDVPVSGSFAAGCTFGEFRPCSLSFRADSIPTLQPSGGDHETPILVETVVRVDKLNCIADAAGGRNGIVLFQGNAFRGNVVEIAEVDEESIVFVPVAGIIAPVLLTSVLGRPTTSRFLQRYQGGILAEAV